MLHFLPLPARSSGFYSSVACRKSSQAMHSIEKVFLKRMDGVVVYEIPHLLIYIFIYKPLLVKECGLNMRVAYPVNLLSKQSASPYHKRCQCGF